MCTYKLARSPKVLVCFCHCHCLLSMHRFKQYYLMRPITYKSQLKILHRPGITSLNLSSLNLLHKFSNSFSDLTIDPPALRMSQENRIKFVSNQTISHSNSFTGNRRFKSSKFAKIIPRLPLIFINKPLINSHAASVLSQQQKRCSMSHTKAC